MRLKILVNNLLAMLLLIQNSSLLANTLKVKELEYALADFAEECSFIKFNKILTESSSENETNRTLVERVKKRLSNSIPEFSVYADELLFQDGSFVEFQPADFNGAFVKNPECLKSLNKFNAKYEIFGVHATDPKGRQALGHVLQVKIGRESYQFYILSALKWNKPIFSHSEWFFEDVVQADAKRVVISDAQLVDLAKGKDIAIIPAKIASRFVEARNALIDSGSVYGSNLYDGQYLNDPHTSWFYTEGIDPNNGEELEIIYFDEFDDGSYSLYFNPKTSELVYLLYEN